MHLTMLGLSYPAIGADAIGISVDAHLRGEPHLGSLARTKLHDSLPRKSSWGGVAASICWLGCPQKIVIKGTCGWHADYRRSDEVMHTLILT